MSPGRNSERWNEMARRNLLDEFTELRFMGFACHEGATETLEHRYRRRVARQLLELARVAVKAAVIEKGQVVAAIRVGCVLDGAGKPAKKLSAKSKKALQQLAAAVARTMVRRP